MAKLPVDQVLRTSFQAVERLLNTAARRVSLPTNHTDLFKVQNMSRLPVGKHLRLWPRLMLMQTGGKVSARLSYICSVFHTLCRRQRRPHLLSQSWCTAWIQDRGTQFPEGLKYNSRLRNRQNGSGCKPFPGTLNSVANTRNIGKHTTYVGLLLLYRARRLRHVLSDGPRNNRSGVTIR